MPGCSLYGSPHGTAILDQTSLVLEHLHAAIANTSPGPVDPAWSAPLATSARPTSISLENTVPMDLFKVSAIRFPGVPSAENKISALISISRPRI